ncbi:MAG: polyprenyl synthetase family protein [Clostridia bacterium]|nr:polyprenyl synthetase family protein [Clostridia bacterium]
MTGPAIGLKEYLKGVSDRVDAFVGELDKKYLEPKEIREGALLYFSRGGKRLRPGLVSLFAGAYGGKEKELAALPAAAAAELFHNWTLIHDDIIDKDMRRRGGPSVQAYIASLFGGENAFEYATDAAILAGDSLHAMSSRALASLPRYGVSAGTALKLLELMDGETVDRLICGETLDTRFALIGGEVSESDVRAMISGKTGALFAFCAAAGTMIGLGTEDTQDERVKDAVTFGFDCGLAFQLKDDVLGIVSDERTLGKPVGGDIKEGKDTLIKLYALSHAEGEDLTVLREAFGNRGADETLIERAKKALTDCGAVAYAEELAGKAAREALSALGRVPEGEYKDLIVSWANSMRERTK